MMRLAGYTLLTFALGVMLVLAASAGQARTAQAATQAATCTFDGGGTLTAGNAARTSDGHVWECTEDGTLTELAASVKPAVRSLPRWAHWKTAPRGACVHGGGIVVWGGHGDGVLICSSGEIETS